jgi:hypothetical protein
MMIQSISKDPRCPYCGRPVLGVFIQGIDGRYHPECTRPPAHPADPHPWGRPWGPWFDPHLSWDNGTVAVTNGLRT